MNASCHGIIRVKVSSHDDCIMSRMCISHVTYDWVTSRTWMHHVTETHGTTCHLTINLWCHVFAWAMSRMAESGHTYECIMTQINRGQFDMPRWICHVHESCRTCDAARATAYICTCICTNVRANLYIYIYICMHVYTYIYVCIHIYICIFTYVHVYIHMYIYVCIDIYLNMYR